MTKPVIVQILFFLVLCGVMILSLVHLAESQLRGKNPYCSGSVGIHNPGPSSCNFGGQGPRSSSWFPGGYVAQDYVHGVTPHSQFNDTLGWGTGSCAPTSAAVAIEYLSRTTVPGIMDTSLDNLITHLRTLMLTTDNGTLFENIFSGLVVYITSRGYGKNVSLGWYAAGLELDGVDIVNEMNISFPGGLRATLHPFTPDYTDYAHELFLNHEQIILLFSSQDNPTDPLKGHVVVGDDISTSPNANGWFNVSFMDPGTATGDHTSTEMSPLDGTLLLFDGSFAHMWMMITISPVP